MAANLTHLHKPVWSLTTQLHCYKNGENVVVKMCLVQIVEESDLTDGGRFVTPTSHSGVRSDELITRRINYKCIFLICAGGRDNLIKAGFSLPHVECTAKLKRLFFLCSFRDRRQVSHGILALCLCDVSTKPCSSGGIRVKHCCPLSVIPRGDRFPSIVCFGARYARAISRPPLFALAALAALASWQKDAVL